MKAVAKKTTVAKAKPNARTVKHTRAAKTPRRAPAEVRAAALSLFGRPTKCTPELKHEIVANIRVGCSLGVAARACGVGRTTLLDWRARGEAEVDRLDRLSAESGDDDAVIDALEPSPSELPFVDFYLALVKAEAEAELRAVTVIFQASSAHGQYKGQWQSAAWWLERHHPERWGRKDRTEPTQTIDLGLRIESVEVTATTTPGASGEVFDVNGAIVAQASRYAHLVSSTADESDDLLS